MALRNAQTVADEVCREQTLSDDFGKGPGGAGLVTANRLALVERLRQMADEFTRDNLDPLSGATLRMAADQLEKEIRDADRS